MEQSETVLKVSHKQETRSLLLEVTTIALVLEVVLYHQLTQEDTLTA